MKDSKKLIELLSLNKIDEHLFVGNSVTIGTKTVFGGQVLAQALHAAYQTVPTSRLVNSLHSYFLEAGDLSIPINYEVAEMRNGGSFSSRRVTATQNGKTIFILAASFHIKEDGFEHQKEINSTIKQPEELLNWDEILEKYNNFIPESVKDFIKVERPFEFKPVNFSNPLMPKNLPAKEHIWFRLKGDHKNVNSPLNHQILAYISDYNILKAAFNPNAEKYNFSNTFTTSLDHSMWFFRDFDFDDWMLYSTESPNAFGARGFVKGNIFTRNGKLIASTAQEGLMRPQI